MSQQQQQLAQMQLHSQAQPDNKNNTQPTAPHPDMMAHPNAAAVALPPVQLPLQPTQFTLLHAPAGQQQQEQQQGRSLQATQPHQPYPPSASDHNQQLAGEGRGGGGAVGAHWAHAPLAACQ